MSTRSVTVNINPELLIWARNSSGYALEAVAKKFRKNPEVIQQWETGESMPTLRQLERISEIYKRPLASFFMSHAPDEEPLPMDFRVPFGEEEFSLSPETRFAIRKARFIQKQGTNLLENLGFDPIFQLPRVTLTSSPDDVAQEIRKLIDVNREIQLSRETYYSTLRYMRNLLERGGIFTFQFSMPIDEIRAFSLTDGKHPVIVINSADYVGARIFSLFHELGHIILESGGICVPRETSSTYKHSSIEMYCNQFSGALLVPLGDLNKMINERGMARDKAGIIKITKFLAKKFKVSRYVILRRMYFGNIIGQAAFQDLMEEWNTEDKSVQRKKSGGRATQAQKAISQRGLLYTSHVLMARDQGIITHADVSDYLAVRQKHISELEALAGGGYG